MLRSDFRKFPRESFAPKIKKIVEEFAKPRSFEIWLFERCILKIAFFISGMRESVVLGYTNRFFRHVFMHDCTSTYSNWAEIWHEDSRRYPLAKKWKIGQKCLRIHLENLQKIGQQNEKLDKNAYVLT